MLYVDKFCRDNPLRPFVFAVLPLVREIRERPGQLALLPRQVLGVDEFGVLTSHCGAPDLVLTLTEPDGLLNTSPTPSAR